MEAESKTGYHTAVGYAFGRRERSNTRRTPYAFLSRRITRLAKKQRMSNPSHLYQNSLATAFTTLSTTGTQFNPMDSVSQGDDYNNRFSSQTKYKRINIKGVLRPGSTAGSTANARITIIKAPQNLSFTANTNSSFSPIVTGASIQVLFDRFYAVPAFSSPGWGNPINISVKCTHVQKFNGTGSNASSGDSIFVIIQSDQTAGTTAPTINGVLEVFFDPM